MNPGFERHRRRRRFFRQFRARGNIVSANLALWSLPLFGGGANGGLECVSGVGLFARMAIGVSLRRRRALLSRLAKSRPSDKERMEMERELAASVPRQAASIALAE